MVYVPMGVDIRHHGHINIIEEARKYGEVTVGLLSDEAISSYKRFPFLKYSEREKIMMNIRGVSKVVRQEDVYGIENIKKLKPKYYVHGDDWNDEIHKESRQKVIEALKIAGGGGGTNRSSLH